MKTFKVTQEQIEEAHSAACDSWKQKLEEWFPDAFEIEFKVGDWVTANNCVVCITGFPENINKSFLDFKGYGVDRDGGWRDAWWGSSLPWRKATQEEVKEALIKEAERRYGENWRNLKLKKDADGSFCCNDYSYLITHNEYSLWNHNGMIFFDGKWAEPMKESSVCEFTTSREESKHTSELEQRVASIEKTLKRIEDKL